MKISLIVIGKTADTRIAELIEDYARRISHYLTFSIEVIPELKNMRSLTVDQQKEKEGEMLLKSLQPADFLALLDERGKEMRSVDFARWLEKMAQASTKRLVFAIGGPYGFSPAVYAKARAKVSLSAMTFPHEMARLIFAEQLYRAMTIIKGEPYHHE